MLHCVLGSTGSQQLCTQCLIVAVSLQASCSYCSPYTDLDPCGHTTPCQNGATCSNTGPGTYECQCTDSYEGVQCEHNWTDECDPNPCLNGGSCSVSLAHWITSLLPRPSHTNGSRFWRQSNTSSCDCMALDLMHLAICTLSPGLEGLDTSEQLMQ